jgi:integrase
MIHELANFDSPLEDTKSVQEVSSGFSSAVRGKTHTDYWLKKVFHPKYRAGDGMRETGAFSVKIQFSGRRELFPLNTANRPDAARKSKQIWASLVANGWDKTLAEHKPQATYVAPVFVTVGDYMDYLASKNFYTLEALYRNQTKFYTVLSSMFENDGFGSRFRARRARLKKANEKLRAVRLSDLTPRRVEEWKNSYLASRSGNPVSEIRAKHTLDSYIRASKAMFGVKIRKRLADFGVVIPEPVPFANTTTVTRGRSSFRYHSRMDPTALTNLALDELQGEKTELLKIFLLALHLGLRRNEIDKLLWTQFDFKRGVLRIEVTEFAQLKTAGSEGDLSLEPELAGFFQSEARKATGIFVIKSTCVPRKTGGWQHYRAHGLLTELCDWLRAKGVDAQKPIHTLRKEFGKLITEKLGLFAASLALRHQGTSVTAIYYADDTRPKHTGLGKLIRIGGLGP